MCGICGFNWDDEPLLLRMTKALRHRGPDAEGSLTDPGISLGHARLAILDLTANAHQPLTHGDKSITYNGEVYNFRAIRGELENLGYRFRSTGDTEVVLKAYDAWGSDCLQKFNGMFAFCIYDRGRRELFLARDRFGIKPLYFYARGERFAFSSEINGLLAYDGIPRDVSPEGLSQFFTLRFTVGSTTLVRDVRKLEPGQCLLYDLDRNRIKSLRVYYSLLSTLARAGPAPGRVELRDAIDAAVARRMIADVPVSCFLSGGLDSSIVSTLASRHAPELNTFSLGFETTNELPFAQTVANHIGSSHHPFHLSTDQMLDDLDSMVAHMDEPVGDAGFLPIYVLSRQVSRFNKVVLSGDGADEIFAGYDRYKMLHYGRWLRHLALAHFGNDTLKRLRLGRGRSPFGFFLEIIRLFDDGELRALGVPPYDPTCFWPHELRMDAVTKAMLFDLATLLPNDFFMKADKMSCAFGLEQRIPFMDHTVVEVAFRIPLREKLAWWGEKRVLKALFADVLAPTVVRRRKHGFNVPIDHWFKGPLGERLETCLRDHDHEYYRRAPVLGLLERMRATGHRYKQNFLLAQKLWSILVFELWLDQFTRGR